MNQNYAKCSLARAPRNARGDGKIGVCLCNRLSPQTVKTQRCEGLYSRQIQRQNQSLMLSVMIYHIPHFPNHLTKGDNSRGYPVTSRSNAMILCLFTNEPLPSTKGKWVFDYKQMDWGRWRASLEPGVTIMVAISRRETWFSTQEEHDLGMLGKRKQIACGKMQSCFTQAQRTLNFYSSTWRFCFDSSQNKNLPPSRDLFKCGLTPQETLRASWDLK